MDKAETKVHQCRDQESGSHETVDVAAVGQETVCKLTYGISEEKSGTDNTQFCFGENTFLHYRFLHYIQAETAYIIHAVAKRCRKKSRPLQPLQAPLTGGHRKVGTRFIGRNLVEIYKMFQHCILLLDLSFASSIATIRRMYSEERRYSVATLR